MGAEARGFIVGAALAYALGVGFATARKPGKLPWTVSRCDYDLEYGTDALEIHADAIKPGQRVLIHDDLLATGGTAAANVQLGRRSRRRGGWPSLLDRADGTEGERQASGAGGIQPLEVRVAKPLAPLLGLHNAHYRALASRRWSRDVSS